MSLTLSDIMEELKHQGTSQNVKVYRRHGATGDLFGVSFANLKALKKKIKTDQSLAESLWETGNIDARMLATMIADPKTITPETAEKWVKDINYYVLADSFAVLIARTDMTRDKVLTWVKSADEYVRRVGYSTLASALKEGTKLSDEDCLDMLQRIEKEIHSSPNRARQAMNNAVIAIGVFRPELSEQAVSAATRIGKVEVDHGDTSCKTPDAVSYIYKSLKRRR